MGGILADSLSGLCLASKGNMPTGNSNDVNDMGVVYIKLTRLVSKLSPYQNAIKNQTDETPSAPLVPSEMECRASLRSKRYDIITVAMQIPIVTNSNNQDNRTTTSERKNEFTVFTSQNRDKDFMIGELVASKLCDHTMLSDLLFEFTGRSLPVSELKEISYTAIWENRVVSRPKEGHSTGTIIRSFVTSPAIVQSLSRFARVILFCDSTRRFDVVARIMV